MANRPTKETVSLKCILTEKERLAYGSQLGENISSVNQKEADLNSVKKQFNAEIAALSAQIEALAEKLRTNSEYREVECRIEYDFEKKIRTWVRTDTGEIYKDDIIPEYMLQEEMFEGDDKEQQADSTEPANT